jgi:hypothetical protein
MEDSNTLAIEDQITTRLVLEEMSHKGARPNPMKRKTMLGLLPLE